jgi:hypothetical protein
MGTAAIFAGDESQYTVFGDPGYTGIIVSAVYWEAILCDYFWKGSFISTYGYRQETISNFRLVDNVPVDIRVSASHLFDCWLVYENLWLFQHQ